MKKILATVAIMSLPLMGLAQDNTWERANEEETTAANPDQKYLAGAVSVVDGRVVFHTTIEAPGKSAKQIYDTLLAYMTKMTKAKNQLEQSRIALTDEEKHTIAGSYREWLVFKSSALVLDRTQMLYNLIVNTQDGKADVNMTRIYYVYDEERDPQTFKAEEWITDKYGLRKNKQKLAKMSGKFRKKTIDRKDYIFKKMEELLK